MSEKNKQVIRYYVNSVIFWIDDHERLLKRLFIAYLIIMAFAFLWLEWWRIAVFYRYITKGY